jgi:hypothetical protein
MEYETNIRQSAMALAEKLCQFPWCRFVGIGKENGEDVFIVYVSKKRLKAIIPLVPTVWEGVPVNVRYVQQPVPA